MSSPLTNRFRFSFVLTLITIFICLNLGLKAQPASVLSEGSWYQLAVTEPGMYHLDGRFLEQQGVDLSNIDVSKIGIFGYGGGMLPQSLSEPCYEDLPENHILVTGIADGQFDADDQILFFAEGPDYIAFESTDGNISLQYQKNLYADTAYYYLSLNQGQGLRIENQVSTNLSATTLDTFDDYWIHESDEINILEPGSGREWYGESFLNGDQLSFEVPVQGLVDGTQLYLQVDALGRTTSASEFELRLNQQNFDKLTLDPILRGTYTDKGKEASMVYSLSSDRLNSSPLLNIQLRYRANDGRGRAHLNRLLLQYSRELRLYGSQTTFRCVKSLSNLANRYVVATDNPDALIWDVTDPIRPKLQEAIFTGQSWDFSRTAAEILPSFIIFDPNELSSPLWRGPIPEHRLPSSGTPDLLIVTPELFRPAAERLAGLRRRYDGLEVSIAEVDDIYRQYASGRQDISAIRNFVKNLYDQNPDQLKYLLLLGDASYDYKRRTEEYTNWIPTYQSRNSLNPIYSFPSDDYYGFMENDEGFWEESFKGDHTLDIGVGRLPVKNLEEANQVVDKLIHYAESSQNLGDWRTKVTFLADDGDNDRYQKDSELLSANLMRNISGMNTNKIYLDAFAQERFPNQELAPEVNAAIEEKIEQGSLLFNFVGHGNEQRLTDENVLNIGMIERWKNLDRMPFFVTATCEFGRFDDPGRVSGAERLVLNPEGGAVGMVTTARPVFSNTNYLLNEAFYEYVFSRQEGEFLRLGDIFLKTKNDALNGRDNRNFTLLADPSMRLAYPEHEIVVDSILTQDGNPADTVKAFQKLTFFGHIQERSRAALLNSFNGELTLSLHDKARLVQTLGNEGTQIQFRQDNNVVNQARASVINGLFSIELIVPQNINYQTDLGRISLYAVSDQNIPADAFGGVDSILIGGSLSNVSVDRTPPNIELYLNDSSFRDGGLSDNDPRLIAYLTDEQGINLSRQQLGHEISAQLLRVGDKDSSRSFILNDFFEPTLNDFRGGIIDYPLGNLTDGNYVLTLQAWDNHNNRSENTIQFTVSDQQDIQVRNFINYPNPFNQSTVFVLEHNRSGDHLLVSLEICDVMGQVITTYKGEITDAPGRMEFLEWNVQNQLTRKLAPGIYFARLKLISATDGQEVESNLRIILTN